jgi:hypothetical protein
MQYRRAIFLGRVSEAVPEELTVIPVVLLATVIPVVLDPVVLAVSATERTTMSNVAEGALRT